MFCKYKDSLGKPGEGVHSLRLPIGSKNFALVDIALTIIFIIAVVLVFKMSARGAIAVAVGVFGTGILLHKLFCVDTAFNKMIGL